MADTIAETTLGAPAVLPPAASRDIETKLKLIRAAHTKLDKSGLSPAAITEIARNLDAAETSLEAGIDIPLEDVQRIVAQVGTQTTDETVHARGDEINADVAGSVARQYAMLDSAAQERVRISTQWIDANDTHSIERYVQATVPDASPGAASIVARYIQAHDPQVTAAINATDPETKAKHASDTELTRRKMLALLNDPTVPDTIKNDIRIAEHTGLFQSADLHAAALTPGSTKEHMIEVMETKLKDQGDHIGKNGSAQAAAAHDVERLGGKPPATPVKLEDIRAVYSSNARLEAAEEAMVTLSKGHPTGTPQARADAVKLMMYNSEAMIDTVEHLPEDLKKTHDRSLLVKEIAARFRAQLPPTLQKQFTDKFVNDLAEAHLAVMEKEANGDLTKIDPKTIDPKKMVQATASTVADKVIDTISSGDMLRMVWLEADAEKAAFWKKELDARNAKAELEAKQRPVNRVIAAIDPDGSDKNPFSLAFWTGNHQPAPAPVPAHAETGINQFKGKLDGWAAYQVQGHQLFATDAKGHLAMDQIVATLAKAHVHLHDPAHVGGKELIAAMSQAVHNLGGSKTPVVLASADASHGHPIHPGATPAPAAGAHPARVTRSA